MQFISPVEERIRADLHRAFAELERAAASEKSAATARLNIALRRLYDLVVTHRFTTGTIGLASQLDLQPDAEQTAPSRLTLWSRVKRALNPPAIKPVPAVCIPPGARLILRDIPEHSQHEYGIGPAEEVTFTQLSAASHTYRDAVRCLNGKEILLQRFSEGQRMQVLALSQSAQVNNVVPEERRSLVLE